MEVEPPGILNWAVEGLKLLRERGRFDIPASVKDAVTDFERDSDPPAQFLEEMCELGDEFSAGRMELYQAYRAWCRFYGHTPKAVNRVREDWIRLGLKDGAESGKRLYRGVRVLKDPDTYFLETGRW